MKLTIKNKVYPKNNHESSVSRPQQKLQHKICCTESIQPSKRKKLIHKRSQTLSNLVQNDLYSYLSRINSKQKIPKQILHTFIMETVEDNKCPYTSGLGFLCCHICNHYDTEAERYYILNSVLETYKPIYWRSNSQLKISIINSTLSRIEQYCQKHLEIVNDIAMYDIVEMYLQSLLLEFIPLQYSQFILKLYMKNPYEEFIRLVVSLVHFVVDHRHVTSSEHASNLLRNAYMGTIEWPIVISNRHNFVRQDWSHFSQISSN